MASQVYLNYKFKHTYKYFDVSLAFCSFLFISFEDIVDYKFRDRERLKLIYFRDELIYLIYFTQISDNFERENILYFRNIEIFTTFAFFGMYASLVISWI